MPGIRGEGRYYYKWITRGIWGHDRTVMYPDFGGGKQIYICIKTHRKKYLKLKNIYDHR